MKNLLIIIALLAFGFNVSTANAQLVSTVDSNESIAILGLPSDGNNEKVVSVYKQLDSHTAKLQEARKAFEEKLEATTDAAEKETFTEAIAEIDHMVKTNERLKKGKAVIHSVKTANL